MSNRLFTRFRVGDWFGLGFSAFLASLLYGVSIPNIPSSFNSNTSQSSKEIHAVQEQFTTMVSWGLPVWLGILTLAIIFLMGIGLLLSWLGSRGKLMLIENILNDRSDIKRPWAAQKTNANAYFAISVACILLYGLCWLIFANGALVVLWPLFSGSPVNETAGLSLLAVLGIFLLGSVPLAIVLFFIHDFAPLWIYAHGGTVWNAISQIAKLGAEHPGQFLLYLLIRAAMGLAFAIIEGIIPCLTCCVGALPYISSVLTLPLSVFRMWFIIECFSQISPESDLRGSVNLPPPLPV